MSEVGTNLKADFKRDLFVNLTRGNIKAESMKEQSRLTLGEENEATKSAKELLTAMDEWQAKYKKPRLDSPNSKVMSDRNIGFQAVQELSIIITKFGISMRKMTRDMRVKARALVNEAIKSQADQIRKSALKTFAANVLSGALNIAGGIVQWRAADPRNLLPKQQNNTTGQQNNGFMKNLLNRFSKNKNATNTNNQANQSLSRQASAQPKEASLKGKNPAEQLLTKNDKPDTLNRSTSKDRPESSEAASQRSPAKTEDQSDATRKQYTEAIFVEAKGRAISQFFSATGQSVSAGLNYLAALDTAKKTELEAWQKMREFEVADDSDFMSTMKEATSSALGQLRAGIDEKRRVASNIIQKI